MRARTACRGEGMLLSAEERDAQAQWVVEENAKRMVVYVQCGSMSTQQTIARIRAAKRIGADGAAVVWRGPIIAGTVKQFWTDVAWGEVDVMLVDMPPGAAL